MKKALTQTRWLDMFPVLLGNYAGDIGLSCIKGHGDFCLRVKAVAPYGTNAFNVFFRKFSRGAAPLREHVSNVICLRSNKKMLRVHAGGVITPMKNTLPFRDFTKMNLPGNPMSKGLKSCAIFSATYSKIAISKILSLGQPLPTLFGLLYFQEKSSGGAL